MKNIALAVLCCAYVFCAGRPALAGASSVTLSDLCPALREMAQDLTAGGPITQPLSRVRLVVNDGITILNNEVPNLDAKVVYQELGSLRSFSEELVDGGRSTRYLDTLHLALKVAPPQATAMLNDMKMYWLDLHRVSSRARFLTPDDSVFRLRDFLMQFKGVADRAPAHLTQADRDFGPWVARVCQVTDREDL